MKGVTWRDNDRYRKCEECSGEASSTYTRHTHLKGTKNEFKKSKYKKFIKKFVCVDKINEYILKEKVFWLFIEIYILFIYLFFFFFSTGGPPRPKAI